MSKSQPWRVFERYVAEHLGLDATISSGSKFFDPGDSVTRGRSHPFPLFVDCKFTEHIGFVLKSFELRQYSERAAELGKRFVMPLRFGAHHGAEDYVILSLHDFKELLDGYQV